MTIDINNMSPQAKLYYINLGKCYGSNDTLAQADVTLGALAIYGAALSAFGFSPGDTQKLEDARDSLLVAGVTRKSAETGAVQKRNAKQSAVTDGKTERATARSILVGARRDLHESNAAEAVTAVEAIDAALEKSASSGGCHAELGKQLSILRDTLSNAVIAGACVSRGGPSAVTGLAAAIDAVNGVSTATKRGTPEETERLDLFDGIIVELTRSARKASRVAARKVGSPAMASAFMLVHFSNATRSATHSEAVAPPVVT